MPTYTLAGQYGAAPLISGVDGSVLKSHSVSIFVHGTFTLATLYTDKTKGSTTANPTSSDSVGNLTFFAVPGEYDLTPLGDTTAAVLVPNDPGDPALLSSPLSANLDFGGNKGINGGTPTLASDLVIKSYVDALVAALNVHASAQWATVGTETFTITSGSCTRINGTTLDGGSPAIGDRIVVKNAPAATGVGSTTNTSQPGNGVYVVTANTTNLTIARATDMTTAAQFPGAYVFVEEGTANAGAGFTIASPGPFTPGTTAVLWTQFSGAGEITVGGGGSLVKSGNQLTRGALTGDVTASADNNATTLKNTGPGATGPIGSTTVTPVVTIDAQGRVTALGSATVVGVSDTQTLSNKRITRRVITTTQSATPTINTDNTDVSSITGLAQAITSFTTNLTGTPADGDLLLIRITDNGTARAITWGAKFEASTVALPTTTVISTMLAVGFLWNTVTSKWRCIAVA